MNYCKRPQDVLSEMQFEMVAGNVNDPWSIGLSKQALGNVLVFYQPTPCTGEQRSAQDYTFEALHRVYFYDAWKVQPVLDAPGSELVLPPQPGLLVHGCCWPQPSATPDVLSVSDRATEEEEHGVQAGQPLSSPAATDATMADEEASEAVSVHSSSSESPTSAAGGRRRAHGGQ